MIDLDKGSNTLDKADGFLTKLKNLLKNHWGILTIIGLGIFIYWIFTLPPAEETQEEYTDQPHYDHPIGEVKGQHQIDYPEEEYYVVKEEYIIDNYGYREGDTVYIDYYNDGYIEMYYSSDYEIYDEEM